jgi:hypothetical protein
MDFISGKTLEWMKETSRSLRAIEKVQLEVLLILLASLNSTSDVNSEVFCRRTNGGIKEGIASSSSTMITRNLCHDFSVISNIMGRKVRKCLQLYNFAEGYADRTRLK